jgi:hypothetical protein
VAGVHELLFAAFDRSSRHPRFRELQLSDEVLYDAIDEKQMEHRRWLADEMVRLRSRQRALRSMVSVDAAAAAPSASAMSNVCF